MFRRVVLGVSGVTVLVSLYGCGIFKSSTSEASVEGSSDSSSDWSKSSSRSSDDRTAYQEDIRDYTSAYAAQGGDPDHFQRNIRGIAEHHGVTNWEADPPTLEAIGSGIRASGLEQHRAELFLSSLATGNSAERRWIQQGYDRPPQTEPDGDATP